MKKLIRNLISLISILVTFLLLGYVWFFTIISEELHYYNQNTNALFSTPIFPLYIRIAIFLSTIVIIIFLYKNSQILKKEIEHRKRFEKEALEKGKNLAKALALSKATLEASADGILVMDRKKKIVAHNQRFSQMWEIPSKLLIAGNDEETVGHILEKVKEPDVFINNLQRLYIHEPQNEVMDTIELQDGRIFERYTSPQMQGNKIIGRVFSFRDITHHKEMEEQLVYQASHDALTLLPNRLILLDRMSQSFNIYKRLQKIGAVLFFDLDRFKLVNDSLGHDIGDILLQSVARRLEHCVRENDTVSRLGGDEFVILLTALSKEEKAIEIALKCLKALEEPFVIDKHTLSITTSIGISFLPKDGATPIELLKNADSAMYYAKAEGRNNYKLYVKKMNAHTKQQLELINELHEAIKKDHLSLYYQPLFDLKTCAIIGAEALLRWEHPTLGFIAPNDFIPVAEDSGLILGIGEWVLRKACLQAKSWENQGLQPIRIAINLSGQQFKQRNIPELVEKILRETELDPQYLELELTESVVMENTQAFLQYMHVLKTMGVHLVIDDFGTGYSSLSYLKRFPVDTLKIDISFISGLPQNSDDAAIVRAILAMAKQLNLNVVAEGIETKEQLSFLQEHGCQMGQGFLFSHAIPAKDFSKLLKENSFRDVSGIKDKKNKIGILSKEFQAP